jgi:hypothetical protein
LAALARDALGAEDRFELYLHGLTLYFARLRRAELQVMGLITPYLHGPASGSE